MNDDIFAEVELEKKIAATFSIDVDIDSVIAFRVPISRTGEATLFLTSKKHLYLYIDSQPVLTLGDVRKIVGKMGLKAESYVPPAGRPRYFDEVGTARFQEVFPGRRVATDADIAYYRTLAPYRPALVLISEVLDGTVYQYDADARTGWRPSTKFTYRRIRTS